MSLQDRGRGGRPRRFPASAGILERLVVTPGGSVHVEALVTARDFAGRALKYLGRLAEAEDEFRQALARSEKSAAAAPDDARWRP